MRRWNDWEISEKSDLEFILNKCYGIAFFLSFADWLAASWSIRHYYNIRNYGNVSDFTHFVTDIWMLWDQYLLTCDRRHRNLFCSKFTLTRPRLRWTTEHHYFQSRTRNSEFYSSITNKMQRYTIVFVTIISLHVSGGSSAHHQELKTVYTASGICRAFTASYRLREQAVRSRKSSTNTRCCVYSFELLMMGGGTAWNM